MIKEHAIVQEHQPDIIIGCESQIDQSYNSSEVFPKGYHVFHKDCCEGGGGVFTCVNNEFSVSEVPSLDKDAELVWVKLRMILSLFVHIIVLLTVCNTH